MESDEEDEKDEKQLSIDSMVINLLDLKTFGRRVTTNSQDLIVAHL